MRLLATALLLLFTFAFQQTDQKTSSSESRIQQRNGQEKTQHEQQQPNPVAPSAGGVSRQEIHSQAEHQDAYDPRHDTLYRAYLWATIIGILIALGGVWVIKRQTNQMQKQLSLQAIALRQWVNTHKWKAHVSDANRPHQLEITHELTNPTRAPILILWVRITTAGGQSEGTGFPQDAMLIPDNPYEVSFVVNLTPEQLALYNSSSLVLTVEGSIGYTDALEEKWEQRYSVTLACKPRRTYSSAYVHTLHVVK